MNAATNGPNGSARERKLLAEIDTLKAQRNDLITKLSACQRQNRDLQAELKWLKDNK